MVVALLHSRLGYGNGVLVGLPAYLMRQLQSVLNAAARLIWRKLKRHLFCQSFPGFCYWHLHLHLQGTLQWQCHLGHSKNFLIDWKSLLLTYTTSIWRPLFPLGVTPWEFRRDLRHQETRVPEPSCGIVGVILCLAVVVQCRLVTDKWTDGQTHDDSTSRVLCA